MICSKLSSSNGTINMSFQPKVRIFSLQDDWNLLFICLTEMIKMQSMVFHSIPLWSTLKMNNGTHIYFNIKLNILIYNWIRCLLRVGSYCQNLFFPLIYQPSVRTVCQDLSAALPLPGSSFSAGAGPHGWHQRHKSETLPMWIYP